MEFNFLEILNIDKNLVSKDQDSIIHLFTLFLIEICEENDTTKIRIRD